MVAEVWKKQETSGELETKTELMDLQIYSRSEYYSLMNITLRCWIVTHLS